jgi:hypothetical protein
MIGLDGGEAGREEVRSAKCEVRGAKCEVNGEMQKSVARRIILSVHFSLVVMFQTIKKGCLN